VRCSTVPKGRDEFRHLVVALGEAGLQELSRPAEDSSGLVLRILRENAVEGQRGVGLIGVGLGEGGGVA